MAASSRLLGRPFRCLISGSFKKILNKPTNSLHLYRPVSSKTDPNVESVQKVGYENEARLIDVAAGKQSFTFDTHEMVKHLNRNGFTEQQAETFTDVFSLVLSNMMENQRKLNVTKSDQEIMLQQVMSHLSAIKKDMIILEKSEFSSLKHENEKHKMELKHLEIQLSDDLQKVRNDFRLDLNMERSRAVEAHAVNEKQLANLHNKIDTDIAHLNTTFEKYRNDMLKYAGGTVLSCLTICLGFYRLWM